MRILPALFIASLIISVSGCQNYREGGSRTVGEFTDDVGIHGSVKTALVRDEQVSGLKIDVDVRRGVVSLYGRVPSEAVRSRAIDIARNVRGVQKVEDRLTIVTE